jgi:sulfonate transport system permease protein
MRLRFLIGWIVPVLLLVVWEAAVRGHLLSSTLLPAPSAVAVAGWRLLRTGELVDNISISFSRAMLGFLIGGGLGLGFGAANGLSTFSRQLLDPSLQMVRNVPHLALIPLVILWFGIGESAKLFLVALGVFFPIYINSYHGIRTADPQLVEMGRAYGMGGWRLFRRVILPGALPSIFVGFRYGLGTMWLTLIVAETIASSDGIGHMAMQAREFLQTDVVVLAIRIYALLGKLADSAVRLLEHAYLPWHPNFQPAEGHAR